MNPGRELDALVAEKVMGLSKTEFRDSRGDAFERMDTYYSTDIAAAWAVLEKMGLSVLRVKDGWYACTVDTVGVSLNGQSSATAPHAICLAALKATQ